jgi:hypothetical protein
MPAAFAKFSPDELGFIQIALTTVLAAVARGELDLNQLALQELASRGLDHDGHWVGFEDARLILQAASASPAKGLT